MIVLTNRNTLYKARRSYLRALLVFLFVLYNLCLYSQQGNQVVLGEHWGMDFNKNPPDTFTNALKAPVKVLNPTSICDCNGKLLLYSSGSSIWDKTDSVLPNGGEVLASQPQPLGGIILPVPNTPDKYYVIHIYPSRSFQSQGGYYSIVDMSLNNGKGDVESSNKHVFFYDFGFYGGADFLVDIAVHSNGADYWLVGYDSWNSKLVVFKITSTGISFSSSINLLPYNINQVTKLKFNNKENKLLLATNVDIVSEFDFNKNTGILSNYSVRMAKYSNLTGYLSNQLYVASLQFSPNDSILYIVGSEYTSNGTGNDAYTVIYQVDYYPGNMSYRNIYKVDSIYYIQNYSTSYFYNRYLGITVGPDQKLYGFMYNQIFQISKPETFGSGCNFTRNFKSGVYDFPSSPGSRLIPFGAPSIKFPLRKLRISSAATNPSSCQIQDSIQLNAVGDANLTNHTWYFYNKQNQLTDSAFGTSIKHAYSDEGVYLVSIKAKNPGNNCTSYTWWSDSLYINKAPRIFAHISNKENSCSIQIHTLVLDSVKFADSIRIDWGDGHITPYNSIPNSGSFNHPYFDSSYTYNIIIEAKNRVCNSQLSLADPVFIKRRPIAKFISAITPQKGCIPLSINLIDSNLYADSTWYKITDSSGYIQFENSANFQITDTGWFDILQYVSNTDGCIDSFLLSKASYVYSQPVVQIIKDSAYKKCLQNDLRIKINSDFADSVLINWGDGAASARLSGNINGNYTDTLTHHFTTPGVYQVTATARNNYCSNTVSFPHLVRPLLQITASNDTTLCKGQLLGLWASASGGDSSFVYILKNGSGYLINSTGSFIVSADTTRVYLIGGINACASDTVWKQIVVTVRAPISLRLNTTDTILCKDNSFIIKANAVGGNGNYFYSLKKNGIQVQNNSNGIFNIVASVDESYIVSVTDHCTAFDDSLPINIKVFNTLQFVKSLPDIYRCANEKVVMHAGTNLGSGFVTRSWYDLTSGTTLGNADTLEVNPSGTMQLLLKVSDACTSIYDTAWINQFPVPAGSSLSADMTSGCIPFKVSFSTPQLSFTNNESCLASWDFGDGSSFIQDFNNTSANVKTSHIYNNPGIYLASVTLGFKNSAASCYTFSMPVEALDIPQIQLSVTPAVMRLPKTKCYATVLTSNADSVVIDWADGYSDYFNTSVDLINQDHEYLDTGHYLIKAVAYNKNTCYTEADFLLFHGDSFTCFIPNAFTPDKNATNEYFKPVLSYCKSYEMKIYDRWGNEVYECDYVGTGPQPSWSGDESVPGTYIYILSAKDGDNKMHNFKGTIMLIR
jgi:PKD repeat protein